MTSVACVEQCKAHFTRLFVLPHALVVLQKCGRSLICECLCIKVSLVRLLMPRSSKYFSNYTRYTFHHIPTQSLCDLLTISVRGKKKIHLQGLSMSFSYRGSGSRIARMLLMNTSSNAWRAFLTWPLNELISHSFSAFEATQRSWLSLITWYILSFAKCFSLFVQFTYLF